MTDTIVNFFYERDEEFQVITSDKMISSGGVYLHGEAEDEVGFDIPFADVNYRKLEDGMYTATVNGKEGYTLYFWKASVAPEHSIPRGLIVKDTDIVSASYAASKFNERSSIL